MTEFKKYSLNIKGRLLEIDEPLIMGIINATPDSFYDRSRLLDPQAIAKRVSEMVEQGADIIDIGACSTRPGAEVATAEQEIERLNIAVTAARKAAGDNMILSIDTYRANVARHCIEELGADIINDISGGDLDPDMHNTIAHLQVPYIVIHMRGTPATMQQLTNYNGDVLSAVLEDLAQKIDNLHQKGVNDIIADPGFGFAKTLEQSYRMLSNLEVFHALEVPLLVGVSRKSMIQKVLDCSASEALNGTTVVNTIAMIKGAHLLRVHDIKAAVEARTIVSLLRNQ